MGSPICVGGHNRAIFGLGNPKAISISVVLDFDFDCDFDFDFDF
jgi:hypothetical protein